MSSIFFPRLLILLVLPCICLKSIAIAYSMEHGSDDEQKTIIMLEALQTAHQLSKWQFTEQIHINKQAIPHSHPVLTLHTRHNDVEEIDLLLSTYLHENLHHYVMQKPEALNALITDLKIRFKQVPVGYPRGARDEYSSYLHLVVCFLEMHAIKSLLSAERYLHVISFWQTDHYTWIYEKVAENYDELATMVQRHQLLL